MRPARSSAAVEAPAPIHHSTGWWGRGLTEGSPATTAGSTGSPASSALTTATDSSSTRPRVLHRGAHGGELAVAAADAGLDDERRVGERRQRADVLGDEHRVPQRQQEQAPDRAVAPLGQQPAEHRRVLVVGRRHGVMVAERQRVQLRPLGGLGPLDHPAGTLAGISRRGGTDDDVSEIPMRTGARTRSTTHRSERCQR